MRSQIVHATPPGDVLLGHSWGSDGRRKRI